MKFTDKLRKAVLTVESPLCVGLDPMPERIPPTLRPSGTDDEAAVLAFCKQIIEATHHYCAAYKPNLAFFEALGPNGLSVFHEVLEYIPSDKIVIADAKRGDIGHTAGRYARAFFSSFDVDAITLNPLMGFETLEPYLDFEDRAIFVLTSTSNPGAADFLEQPFRNRASMSIYIAERLKELAMNRSTHCGMVVGATHPEQIEPVCSAYPNATLLIPGVGTQGGSIEKLRKSLINHQGIPLITVSRSIIYPTDMDSITTEAEYIQLVQKATRNFNKQLLSLDKKQGHAEI